MIKPTKLKKGDKVAIVSLSAGILGEPKFIHKYNIAKKRLEEEFGLEVVAMPNALKGAAYLANNPKARADDLMDALKDKSIKAIICAIGGSDTYKLLPYIDFNVIKENPKIFTGFSDSTIDHLMFYKEGVVSFYGPNIMCNFGEYTKMFDYEVNAVKEMLFKDNNEYEIKSSPVWSNETIWWDENNINKQKKTIVDSKGYEVLQGKGKAEGILFGGCIDSLSQLLGYANSDEGKENAKEAKELNEKYNLFPKTEDLKETILFLETSDEFPTPTHLEEMLNIFIERGIIDVINGIIVGKPKEEKYYEEYKEVYKRVIGKVRKELPIIYNVNIGHAQPIGILPYGINCELDLDNKKITLKENFLEK